MTPRLQNAGTDLSGYPWEPLAEKAYFQEGPGILAKDFTSDGIPLVRLSGLGGYEVTLKGCNFVSNEKGTTKWNHFRLIEGDILVSTSASFGRPAVVGREAKGAIFYTGLIRFRPHDEELDAGYLKIFLGSELFLRQAESLASGSVIRHFGPSHLREMRIPIPPLPEQRAIAATLGALDTKIELNRRMNETLEAMARSLFRDWFVDFGPTRAKMAGTAPYLSTDLWSLFPHRLDNEGKPEGWENVPMDSLAEVTMGTSPDGSTYNDTAIGTPLCNGPVEYGDFFLRQIKWTTAPKKLACRGDLIICVRGSTTGRHAFADAEYCLGRGVASIRGHENNHEFVETALLTQMNRLLQKTTGSVFPSLATQDIKKFALTDPGHSLRLAFATIARPLRDMIWLNAEESRTLAQTRDLLLPRLMSGELRVSEATIEREVEA